MVSEWILIIFLSTSGGVDSSNILFESKKACEDAKFSIQNDRRLKSILDYAHCSKKFL